MSENKNLRLILAIFSWSFFVFGVASDLNSLYKNQVQFTATIRIIGETIGIILIINGTSSFLSNTLLIRFPILLLVYNKY